MANLLYRGILPENIFSVQEQMDLIFIENFINAEKIHYVN